MFKVIYCFISIILFLNANVLYAKIKIENEASKTQTNITNQQQDTVKLLREKMPDIIINDIKASKIPGMLQIESNTEIFYLSNDGRYLFYGDVLDLNKSKENWDVTEDERRKLRIKLLSNIKKVDLVSFSPENSKTSIFVFTDIDCGYCRKLHNSIDKLTAQGITVNYLAFPRTGPDSKSFKKAVNVWCSENKQISMSKAKAGESIPAATCDHPVAEQFELGKALGVRGTPTIVFADGSWLPGYMPADQLADLAIKHAN